MAQSEPATAPDTETTDPATDPADDTDPIDPDTGPAPLLTAVEARVLGCLIEKKYTTPNNYPLTLNAVVQACNQKTSRDPVMHLDPGEVGRNLNHLRDRTLVSSEFAGRTERYDERLARHLLLDRKCHAIICTLMLRGPQTPGELRINASRMAEFDDMQDLQEALERLLAKRPPLVLRLPRMAGKREERYAHLLCGAVELPAASPAASPDGPATDAASVSPAADARISALEAEVATLRAELERLWDLTGLQRDDPQ